MKKKFQGYQVSETVNLKRANEILNEDCTRNAGKFTFVEKKFVAWILDSNGRSLSYTSFLKDSDLLENHRIYLVPRQEGISDCYEVAA